MLSQVLWMVPVTVRGVLLSTLSGFARRCAVLELYGPYANYLQEPAGFRALVKRPPGPAAFP